MTAKADSHHVVNLTFVPLGGPPYIGDGWQFRLLLAHVCFQTQITKMAISIEVVNDRESRVLAVVIDAGDVHQVIKSQVSLCEGANLRDLLRIAESERDFPAKLGRFRDIVAELAAQRHRQL